MARFPETHIPQKKKKTTTSSTTAELLRLWLLIIALNLQQLTSSPAVNTCTHVYPGPLKWLITHGDTERASLTMRSVKCTNPLHPPALSFQSHTHIAPARSPSGVSGMPHRRTHPCAREDSGGRGVSACGWGPLNCVAAHKCARVLQRTSLRSIHVIGSRPEPAQAGGRLICCLQRGGDGADTHLQLRLWRGGRKRPGRTRRRETQTCAPTCGL